MARLGVLDVVQAVFGAESVVANVRLFFFLSSGTGDNVEIYQLTVLQ